MPPGMPQQEAIEGPAPRYELRGRIGQGAMGTVDRVWDRELCAEVALKRLVEHRGAQDMYRLKQEFRVLRDLTHANLVRLYDLDVSEDTCFFTMELIEGEDFLGFVRAGAAPPPASVPDPRRLREATLQLVWGLQALHAAGKVHRDVKPSNVLVDGGGRVVLVDFGLVLDTAARRGRGGGDGLAGTFAYMAPELLLGAPASRASDWYSVGAMLFEALTGCLPFDHHALEVADPVRRAMRVSPARLIPDVPLALDDVVQRLLAPDPAARAGGEDVLAALGEASPPLGAFDPADLPFVGRSAELARLASALAAAHSGASTVAHVCGPSGIGKSELVRRFLDQTDGDTVVLTSRCHLRETVPHQALDALVDELSGELLDGRFTDVPAPHHAAALLRLFPVLGRVPSLAAQPAAGVVEPQELRRRGIQAFRELLAALADRKPVVVWIDDAQWADPDSALVVRDLLSSPDLPRFLLVLSYRSDDAPGPLVQSALAEDRVTHERLDLAPLSPADVRTLAASLLRVQAPGPWQQSTIDSVVKESAGSPFFVGELTRVARARAGVEITTDHRSLTLTDVVNVRLYGLETSSRSLLELVAVAGRPIRAGLALGLAGLGPAGRRLVRELSGQCLLRARGAGERELVEVYHDRIRETLVADLSPESRRARHRQLADAFAAQDQPDLQALVEHYLGAGQDAVAAQYAVPAGDEAFEALAFERAAELFGLAFRLRGAQDADGALLRRRADALANAGRGSDAADDYLAAAAALRATAPDRGTDLTLRCLAGDQYLASGRLRQGIDVLWQVLADLGEPVPGSAASARRMALALRLRLFMRPLDVRMRAPAEVPPDLLHRLDALWAASKGTIMLDAVLANLLSARHLVTALKAGHPGHLALSLCIEASFSASFGGRLLRRRSQRAHALAESLVPPDDAPYQRGWIHGSDAGISYWNEQWTDTVVKAERAVELFRTQCRGASWEATTLQTFLLAALVHLGRVRELNDRLPVILDDARRRGDLFGLSLVRTGHPVLAPLAADDPERALHEAESMLEPFQTDHFTSQHFHHLIATVQAHLYTGQPWSAWGQLADTWPSLRQAGYLFLACLACQLRYLRAIAALAAADTPPPDAMRAWTPRRLERVARVEAWLLDRAAVPSGAPRAAAIRAALSARRGNRARQRQDLAAAIEGFDGVGMALHREATRLQLAALDDSAAAWTTAEASLRAEGVRQPSNLLRTLVAGPAPAPPRGV